jgi:hypothetical protein
MTSKQITLKILMTVNGFLVLVGIVVSVLHYIREPYNAEFTKYPIVTIFYIVPGNIYLELAPC